MIVINNRPNLIGQNTKKQNQYMSVCEGRGREREREREGEREREKGGQIMLSLYLKRGDMNLTHQSEVNDLRDYLANHCDAACMFFCKVC